MVPYSLVEDLPLLFWRGALLRSRGKGRDVSINPADLGANPVLAIVGSAMVLNLGHLLSSSDGGSERSHVTGTLREALEQNACVPASQIFTSFPPAAGEGVEHVILQGVTQGTRERPLPSSSILGSLA